MKEKKNGYAAKGEVPSRRFNGLYRLFDRLGKPRVLRTIVECKVNFIVPMSLVPIAAQCTRRGAARRLIRLSKIDEREKQIIRIGEAATYDRL